MVDNIFYMSVFLNRFESVSTRDMCLYLVSGFGISVILDALKELRSVTSVLIFE